MVSLAASHLATYLTVDVLTVISMHWYVLIIPYWSDWGLLEGYREVNEDLFLDRNAYRER